MPDQKISALTAATALGNTDELVLAVAGANKKLTGTILKAAMPSAMAVCLPNYWQPLWDFTNLSTQAWAAGLLRLSRVTLPNAIKAVQIEPSTGTAGAVFRVGVYSDTPSGPDALLYQTADISGAVTGAITSALVAPAGSYWIGVQNISGNSCPLRAVAGMYAGMPGFDAPGSNNSPNAWTWTGKGSALPNPAGAPTTRTGLLGAIFVQAS